MVDDRRGQPAVVHSGAGPSWGDVSNTRRSATDRTSPRHLLLVGGALLLVIGVGVAAILASGSPGQATASDPLGTPSAAPTLTPAPVAPPPVGTTYRDFVRASAPDASPPASRGQSRLWFAHDRWWAVLSQPSTGHVTIFRLDWETQRWVDTGVLVDERTNTIQDVVWSGEHAYIVTAGARTSARDAIRVRRFSFDEAADRFELDPNFPVTIAPTGTAAAFIAVDSAGTAWISYTATGQIWLAATQGDDARWSEPFPLVLPGAIVDGDGIASIAAFGPGRIGVLWSNQLAGSVSFTTHVDGEPPDAWSEPEVVLDGIGTSEGHMSLATYPLDGGTQVVAALETSLDQGDDVNSLDPGIVLAVRSADGTWATHLVSQVRDRQGRAVVMVDGDAGMFYVAATSPARGGTIVYKRTAIGEVRFETGDGTILMASAQDPRLDEATTTKGALTAGSGLVALAADVETQRYVHALIDLGAGLPPADPADRARLAPPAPPEDPPPLVLAHDDFEPWPIGPADATDWSVGDGSPSGALTIADDGDGGRVLRVQPAGDGASVRACRELSEDPDARLRIQLRVRVSAVGDADTSLLQLRGSGGDAGGVRLSSLGDLAWFDGPVKARSETATFTPGRWYRVEVTVDQPARTYDFVVKTDDGDDVLQRGDLAWRSADVRAVRTICIESTVGTDGQALDVSEISVSALPAR